MTNVVPTIRAGALHPAARWLHLRGRPVEPLLDAAGLGAAALDDPHAPVPVVCVVAALRAMARAEGPEALLRAWLAAAPLEIGGLGKQLLAAGALDRALQQIDGAMARHCTHETITVVASDAGMTLRDAWALSFDPETLHCVHAYTAGIVGAFCAATVAPPPLFSKIALTPHPERGLEHLRPWLDGVVVAGADAALAIDIPWAVVRAPFRTVGRDAGAPQIWRPLREGQSFSTSVERVIIGMMGDIMGGGVPGVDRVAAASGMSVRTFQRRLIAEGSTFSAAVDAARRAEALALITGTDMPMAEIAARLGYANASALTRAVRRWTGASPRSLRSVGGGDTTPSAR